MYSYSTKKLYVKLLLYCLDDEDKTKAAHILKQTNISFIYFLHAKGGGKRIEEKECESGTKCVEERMKHVRSEKQQNRICIMADGHDTLAQVSSFIFDVISNS